MSQLQNALKEVTVAVDDTKKLTDSAFSDLNNSSAAQTEEETEETEETSGVGRESLY